MKTLKKLTTGYVSLLRLIVAMALAVAASATLLVLPAAGTTLLNAPTGVTLSASHTTAGAVAISYTASTNAPPGQIYTAEVCTGAGMTGTCFGPATITSGGQVAGLTPGTNYYATVTAIASSGYTAATSGPAGPQAATIQLNSPTNVLSSASPTTAGAIVITFTPPAGPAPTSYTATACTNIGMTTGCTLQTITSGGQITGLAAGTGYYVTITANASSGHLASISATVGPQVATTLTLVAASSGGIDLTTSPQTVTLPATTTAGDTIVVACSATSTASNDIVLSGAGATWSKYQDNYEVLSIGANTNSGSTSVTLTDTYSGATGICTVGLLAGIATVSPVYASANSGAVSANAHSAVTSSLSYPAGAVLIAASDEYGSLFSVSTGTWSSGASDAKIDTGLHTRTSLLTYARPSSSGSSTYTSPVPVSGQGATSIVVALKPSAPGTPTINEVLPGSGQVTAVFTPGADGRDPVTGYTTTACTGVGMTGTCSTATGSSSVLTVTGLTAGTSYYVTVSATNAMGTTMSSVAGPATVAANTPAPAETLGSGSEAELPTQVVTDSVDTENGNLSKSYTDISLPGRGVPLSFARTYNSTNATTPGTDGLGEGWTGTWSDSINYASGTGDSVMNVTESDGAVDSFTNVDGVWTPPAREFATLSENGSDDFVFTVSKKTVYTFSSPGTSAPGQLLSVKDLAGDTDTLAYNGSGQLITVTDSATRALTFGYNAHGELTSVADPMGNTETYTYSSTTLATANLLTATDPDGNVTTYTYNGSSELASTTDPTGAETTFSYTSGTLSSQTSPLGGVTSYTYSVNSAGTGTTTQTAPSGAVTTVTYTNGEATSSALSYSGLPTETTSYTYDPTTDGIATETDPDGNVTTYTYNALGEPLTVENALGGTTTYTYDSLGDQLTAENPDGITTTNTYNTAGNILTSSTPLTGDTGSSGTAETTYTYGNSLEPSDVTAVENPDGGVTHYTYDSYGDVTSVTDPDGNETAYTYNEDGEKLMEVAPDGNVTGGTPADYTTSYTYDADGNTLATTSPNGGVTTDTYNGVGAVATSTDPDGNITTYTYDGDGNLLTTLYADSTSTSATYNSSDERLTSTDASGNVTTYTYDAYGNMTSMENPLSETTSYGYNDANEQTTLTDPASRVTTTTYDGDGNVTGVSYSDGITPDVTYTFNNDNQMTVMSDGTGTTDYTYNSLGAKTSATEGSSVTGYSHDLDGNVLSITYPVSSLTTPVTYTYDTANRMTSVTDFFGGVTNFTYDASGNLTNQADPNGVAIASTYDPDNNPTAIVTTTGATTQADLAYTYDAADQVLSETDTGAGFPSATPQTYTYTPTQRIATVNGNTTSYTDAGSITGLENGTAQTYNAGSELTSSTPSGGSATTYSYNALGERTGATYPDATTSSLTYNQDGDLTSFTPSSDFPSLSAASYTYSGNGLLASETIGSATSDFAWDTTTSLPLMLSDGTSVYIYGPSSTPLEQVTIADNSCGVTPGDCTFLSMDAQGSLRAQFDDSGSLLGSASYDTNGSTTATTGAITGPIGYDGQWSDPASKLLYLRARWYDPTAAQFASVDPEIMTTMQAYEYAADNPINNVDPNGLSKIGGIGKMWTGAIIVFFGGTLNLVGGVALLGAQPEISVPLEIVGGSADATGAGLILAGAHEYNTAAPTPQPNRNSKTACLPPKKRK